MSSRRSLLGLLHRVGRPGYDRELPRFTFRGASRWGAPAMQPEEQSDLFGRHWSIERLPEPPAGSEAAAFLMTRAADRAV